MAELPVLNHTLDMTPGEVGAIWSESVPMPFASERDDPEDATRIRLSNDGAWVVRRHAPAELSAEQVVENANVEFNRLRELGLNVVTFAHVPSVTERHVFTVTPWISEIAKCKRSEFRHKVAPIIDSYVQATEELPVRLDHAELYMHQQYSALTSDRTPFLHDVDPYFSPTP